MATRRRASQSSLTGSISDIQRRVKYLQNKQTPTRLGNQSVQRSAIQYRAVGTDQIAPNSIVNDQIQADAIKQAQLDTNSVGRDELINGEVIESKLGTDAVTNTKIKDGEVIKGKLGSAAVELVNMSPNSVANSQLTTDSVNFRTVDTNAIGNENMLDNSVGNSELQSDSVGSGELRNDSVGFAELQSNSVGNSTLQTGSVTRTKLGSGSVGPTQLADLAVTTAKIATQAVTGTKIADGTISSSKLGAATPAAIVAIGAAAGTGITKSGATFSARFGGGSAEIARGNHRHSAGVGSSNSNVIVLASNVARAGHSHTVTISAPISSSLRYKKEIQNYKPENLHALLKLQMKKYKYKNTHRSAHDIHNSEWMYGYIAEEVDELGLTEIVSYNKEGQPEALNYSLLSTLLLELVKEQQEDIELLKKDVKKLLRTKND